MVLVASGCSDKSTDLTPPTDPTDTKPLTPLDPATPAISYTLDSVPENPPEVDTWIITDRGNTATTEDFSKLRMLLGRARDRKITLIFPNITAIPEKAFNHSTQFPSVGLVSVSAPKAETIGQLAFVRCIDLKSVNFPKATSIGQQAFFICEALTSVTLPEAKSIRPNAFAGATALTTVVLPKAEIIQDDVFKSCTSLTTMTIAIDDTGSALELNLYVDAFNLVDTANITVTTSAINADKFVGFKEVIIKN